MPKNDKGFSLFRQKAALLILEWSEGFRPAGSLWVLLLALRGFSLVEIGFAEAVFHAVSFCCELPSGLLDDSLQLVSDKRLNDRFPSTQRATLISVSSMLFSAFMMPLSPLFGWWFS